MSYLVQSHNGEGLFNKFLSPDLDHLRGGSSHGFIPSCVKKIKSIRAIVFELRAQINEQPKDPNALPLHFAP